MELHTPDGGHGVLGHPVGAPGAVVRAYEGVWPRIDPDAWVAPGGWLHQFRQEMQTLLLAELETRLEPVQGLLDALNHEEPLPQ